ncbi:UNVERIFIED_CONTAM: hypothetical protein K2H54_041195 [Gekko kuhli]
MLPDLKLLSINQPAVPFKATGGYLGWKLKRMEDWKGNLLQEGPIYSLPITRIRRELPWFTFKKLEGMRQTAVGRDFHILHTFPEEALFCGTLNFITVDKSTSTRLTFV